jgi:LemA protein
VRKLQAIYYYIILGIVLGLLYSYLYNRLVKYSNAADAGLGQIKVALKKRLDLVEELLGAVKGYMTHERETFEKIAELRAGVENAKPGELNNIDKQSREIVNNLLAVAEAYPQLKASENIMKLMDTIVSVENEIARQRYTYNNIVQQYNTMLQTIPSNIVAATINAKKLQYLEFEEAITKAPDIGVLPYG